MPRGIKGSGKAKAKKKANGKARSGVSAPIEEHTVTAAEVTKLPSERKLKALARTYEHAKGQTSEISGSLGSAVRTMVENDGLHAEAFRRAMAEKKKDAERLRTYLDHLEYYRDVFGVTAKAESVLRLPLGRSADEPLVTGDDPFPEDERQQAAE